MFCEEEYRSAFHFSVFREGLYIFEQLFVVHVVGDMGFAPERLHHMVIQMVKNVVPLAGDGVVVNLLRPLKQVSDFLNIYVHLFRGNHI